MRIQTQMGEVNFKNFAEGKQAGCVLLEGGKILKVSGETQGYTREEAEMLVEETTKYRQELTECGIKTPKSIGISCFEQDGSWNIAMVDEFVGTGRDIKQELSDDTFIKPEQRIGAMIGFLTELPDGDLPHSTKVMGDFKPDNFVWDDEDGLIFIDYFGPKRYGKDGLTSPYLKKIDTFPRETITFFCGDRRGQITRLLAMVNMYWPRHLKYAEQAALNAYEDEEVLAYIKKEIDNGYKQTDDIYKMKEWRMDGL